MPCRHAIVFAQRQRLPGGATLLQDAQKWHLDMFNPVFRVESLLRAYGTPITAPLREELDADGVTEPAQRVPREKSGRPRKRRHRSRGEASGGKTAKVQVCTLCKEKGHNSRTCLREGHFM